MNYEICNFCIYECIKIFFLLFLFYICIADKIKFMLNLKDNRIIRDVLFISGCKLNLPQSYHYRVLHQIEQLNAGFLVSSELFYSYDKRFSCNYFF